MTYQINCTNTDFLSLYRKMKSGGILDKTIDALDGKPDGVIVCEGIAETALLHAERYGKYIEKITGRKVSWLIDEKTKRKVRTVAGMARTALIKQGYRPGEKDFEKQLASALVRFAFAPTLEQRKRLAYCDKQWLDSVSTRPFLDMGMRSIARYLEENGGFGLINPPVENEFEATAREFLAEGRGLCTVRSKVLYAVLKEGGLKPFFACMRPEDIRKNFLRMINLTTKTPPATFEDYFGGHIFVGIMNGPEPLYIEPNAPLFDVDYDEYAKPISLREMHQADMANLISDIRRHDGNLPPELASTGATAERLIDGALAIGGSEQLAYIYMTEGQFSAKNRNFESAILFFETALGYDPAHTQAAISMCVAREMMGDAEAAKACLEKLPDDATQKALGLATYHAGKRDFARAREFMKRAIELGAGAPDINRAIAISYIEEKNYAGAEEYLRKTVSENPSSFPDTLFLADVLIQQEKWREAADALKDALALDSANLDALLKMAKTLIKLGRADEARRYATRYFISYASTGNPLFDGGQLLGECLELSQTLGMWRELKSITGTLWQRNFKMHAVVIANALAHCRMGKTEEAARLLGVIESNTEPEFPLLPEYYKHLASIAECADRWAELARICMKNRMFMDIYNIHMLHAAVKSGNEALIKEAANLASAFADEMAKLDPKSVNLDALDKIYSAISEMPRGIGSHPLIKPVFAKYLDVIAKIYEANGRQEAAAKAKRQAGQCGAR